MYNIQYTPIESIESMSNAQILCESDVDLEGPEGCPNILAASRHLLRGMAIPFWMVPSRSSVQRQRATATTSTIGPAVGKHGKLLDSFPNNFQSSSGI